MKSLLCENGALVLNQVHQELRERILLEEKICGILILILQLYSFNSDDLFSNSDACIISPPNLHIFFSQWHWIFNHFNAILSDTIVSLIPRKLGVYVCIKLTIFYVRVHSIVQVTFRLT